MSRVQQNKQGQQPKRIPYNKFLSIKAIVRNKKMIIKKSVPSGSFFNRNNNTFSTCELSQKNIFAEQDQLKTHRGFSATKHSFSANTNIITIKFGEQIIQRGNEPNKLRKKLTNTFNICADQVKKPSFSVKDKISYLGPVQDSLIIEPLQKFPNHFEWERKKNNGNYILLAKKKRKGTQDCQITRQTSSDLRQIGKQFTQTQFYTRKTSNSIAHRTNNSFFGRNRKKTESFQEKQAQTISVMSKHNISEETGKLQKAKQKQLTQTLLKQYREILPLRKPSNKKDYFVFGMSDKPTQPQNKIQLYRDFLWKINYSNGLYVYTPDNIDANYKAYVGFGNNSCMVKSILRRRTWWTIVESNSQIDSCQFVWTQLKINYIFKGQVDRPQLQGKPAFIQEVPQTQQQIKLSGQFEEEQAMKLAHNKIFNKIDSANWENHTRKNWKVQQKFSEQTHIRRLRLYTKKQINKIMESSKLKIHNHLQFNYYLGNKKALFYNVKRLCQCRHENPFQYIPQTYHVSKGTEDPIYESFLNHYKKLQDLKKIDKNFRNIWICKPGQNTNRGNGISVCFGLDDVRHRLRGKQKNGDGKPRTFILQKYIEKPFLYKNRKFDIRHYILLTCFNGRFKAYWFDEGYVRTSSSIFSLKNSNDLMVHLTNDAVQKKGDGYGKHEKGNKVSYQDFQNYLDTNYKKNKYNFLDKTLQKMKKIALTAVEATYCQLDPNKKQHNFELIGLDFMIDQSFKPWLIQANTNPCLQLSSPLLQKLIPTVIQQTFRICIDPFFPPPQSCSIKNKFFGQNALLQNRYQLIFDESIDGHRIQELLNKKNSQYSQVMGKIQQDNEVFEDDGNQDWQQKNAN